MKKSTAALTVTLAIAAGATGGVLAGCANNEREVECVYGPPPAESQESGSQDAQEQGVEPLSDSTSDQQESDSDVTDDRDPLPQTEQTVYGPPPAIFERYASEISQPSQG